MARLPNQNMTPGLPAKPADLSKAAAREWDRLLRELVDSGIRVAKAHGRLLEQACNVRADLLEAAAVVKEKGAYYKNPNTGAILLHPAARRLDGLRRDYVKVLSLLGLRSAVADGGTEKGKSLEAELDE
jgi:phage terminase small subunit